MAEGVSTGQQFGVQAIGVAATVAWSVIFTFIIVKVTMAVAGLRASEDEIIEGLDVSSHGESGYSL
ncbi:MAG TPA: ammonium transporter [Rhodospirillales bacterium]|nr:ammonium transporter [Rhodospirillales bacterium]